MNLTKREYRILFSIASLNTKQLDKLIKLLHEDKDFDSLRAALKTP